MRPVAGPHDLYFKKILSDPKHASSELRAVMPAELARHIDWATLALRNATFIDEALQDRYADLVFSAAIGGTDGYVYVLFEHQSTVDALIRFGTSLCSSAPSARSCRPSCRCCCSSPTAEASPW
jgi:predicted transposase YdaD